MQIIKRNFWDLFSDATLEKSLTKKKCASLGPGQGHRDLISRAIGKYTYMSTDRAYAVLNLKFAVVVTRSGTICYLCRL